jgi:hypothetical protein
MAISYPVRASQEPAFVLSGNFEDIFANKHNIGGSFTVKAFESNALIDMTLEHGFRQVVGTDGHDSFDYCPIGLADISSGRFPSNAHEFEQFLWLVCVHDPELITNLHSYGFSFYGSYTTNDVVLQIKTNNAPPNLISSIKWYAPNYAVAGTNHYELSMYPKGYLMAELAVTKTSTNDHAVIPSEVAFNQFSMAPFDLSKPQGSVGHYDFSNLPIRNQNDVAQVEFALFSMTNIQVTSPLSSYIPEIPDKNARVNDERFPEMGVVMVASSGKWWTARELYQNRETSVKPHRKIILISLLISFLFPIFLLIRMWKHGDSKIHQKDNQ